MMARRWWDTAAGEWKPLKLWIHACAERIVAEAAWHDGKVPDAGTVVHIIAEYEAYRGGDDTGA